MLPSTHEAQPFPFPFALALSFPFWNVTFNEILMSRFSNILTRLLNMLGKSSTSSMAATFTSSLLVLDSLLDSSFRTH